MCSIRLILEYSWLYVSNSDLAVDDIEIENGACDYDEASCSFEDGYCAYYNTNEGDKFDWLRDKGRVYKYTGKVLV
jgi:hypothetical protein